MFSKQNRARQSMFYEAFVLKFDVQQLLALKKLNPKQATVSKDQMNCGP
jgi:hypothetical protein